MNFYKKFNLFLSLASNLLFFLRTTEFLDLWLRSGQFAPGQSGNPGSRPKDEHRVADLARSYTLEAINTLVELMRNDKNERLRGTAAQALIHLTTNKKPM